MSHILLTGFMPFDGREFNASWIAARALISTYRGEHILHGLRVPVCWGQPKIALTRALAQWQPRSVIAMGEGAPGLFRIETLARNQRAARKDNNDQLPPSPLIDPQGPATRNASAPACTISAQLSHAGYPIQTSSDAGAYLCEEMLYTLECFKEQHSSLQSVLFVHLPPFGSDLEVQGQPRQCDESLLLDFSVLLLASLAAQQLL